MTEFSEKEIQRIYKNIVKKDNSYFNKGLPKCPIKKWHYSWNGKDAPRNFCIRDFQEWVKKHNLEKPKNLGYTCESDPELEFLNPEKKVSYPYKDGNNDLHNFEVEEKHDFFMFHQTLEHVYNPWKVVENIGKNVSPGGYVFTSVPTINIPHSTPFHFTGIYPMGLALMFISAGFEIVETGQWGNCKYITTIFSSHNWPDVRTTGIKNEERNVAQCWILAKKL